VIELLLVHCVSEQGLIQGGTQDFSYLTLGKDKHLVHERMSQCSEAAPAVCLWACQYACLRTSLAGWHSVCGNWCVRASMRVCMHTCVRACVRAHKGVEAVEVQQYGCFVVLLYAQRQMLAMHMVFQYPSTVCVS